MGKYQESAQKKCQHKRNIQQIDIVVGVTKQQGSLSPIEMEMVKANFSQVTISWSKHCMVLYNLKTYPHILSQSEYQGLNPGALCQQATAPVLFVLQFRQGLTKWRRLALNLPSFCLSHQIAGIIGCALHYHLHDYHFHLEMICMLLLNICTSNTLIRKVCYTIY